MKKNKHEVSNAINILDPSKAIDGKICKAGTCDWVAYSSTGDNGSHAGKCATKSGIGGGKAANPGLGVVVSTENQPSNNTFTDDKKMDYIPKTSAVISGDISALNRDQKGVVSSAFAKAHDVSNAINILDPSKGIDAKICTKAYRHAGDSTSQY